MKRMTAAIGLSLVTALVFTSCDREPEVGSPEWCEAEKTSGRMDDYMMNEVATFAKHCMFSQQKDE